MAAGFACQVLVPLDNKGASAEQTERNDGSATGLPDPCGAGTIPRPEKPSPNESALPDLVFAVNTLRFEPELPADAGSELCRVGGFNLDEKETCYENGAQHDPNDCPGGSLDCAWSPACKNGSNRHDPCDEPGGIDNAIGKGLSTLTNRLPFVPKYLFDPMYSLRTGQAGVILRLAGYNGALDDQYVSFIVLRSSGLENRAHSLLDAGADAADQTGAIWDGLSLRRWDIHPQSIARDDPPSTGWVTNGILRVKVDRLMIPLGGRGFEVKDVTMTGELRQIDGAWQIIRGRVGGHISVADMLQAVALFPTRSGDKTIPLCAVARGQMEQLKAALCEFADLPADGTQGACEAVSVGARFTAVPALLGMVRGQEEDPTCPDPLPEATCP
jgi:hypothetical protein